MPIVYPANLYSVDIEMMCEDVPANIKQYYRLATGSPVDFPALDLVNIWVSSNMGPLLDCLSSAIQVMRVIGRCLHPSDGVPYEANFDETNVGTGGAEPLPPSIAALLKFKTTSTFSRNNGHAYLPGCPENTWVNGAWTAGQGTFLTTLVNAMAASLPSPTPGVIYAPCVVSRFLGGVERVTAATFDVISGSYSARISQQRRRMSGQQGIKT